MTISYTFDDGIPAANNNPSNDQPKMLQNNISTKQIIATDHVTFDSTGSGAAGAISGQHLKVTYNNVFAPALPTNPISIGYTKAGVASPISDLYFRNANGIFPQSNIRAWAFCSGTVASPGNSVIANQQINVTSVIRNSVGNYTVTLVANVVNGPGPTNNFGILISSTLSATIPAFALAYNYTITGTNTFTIRFFDLTGNATARDPTNFTFQVLQV